MAKFRITYAANYGDPEVVEADDYIDEDKWITFRLIQTTGGAKSPIQQVLRVQAATVVRIELIESS